MDTNATTPSQLVTLLQKGYEAVVDGNIPGMESAKELAASYLKDYTDRKDAANALVRWQNVKCAIDGFITGVPGLPALPVTLPANIMSTYIIHLRMIAAIAAIGGYDLKDDRVQSLVLLSLAGESLDKMLRPMGISVAEAIARGAICKAIPRSLLGRINSMVGLKLISKFSEKSIIQLGKLIPFAGGVLGGVVDGVTSNIIGNIAIGTFLRGCDETDSRIAA
ncbi:MAG: EcsC family protein [Fibrobacter sp.]|uniref:EcsC family protein n=1 Tax=Fibrobacter sp. TaxID=35828 RepID=UPI0025C270F0|nr:EcsC family protein [Fibrobacter sp.]MBQ3716649.1 EcsC family protein [Fibrobacter sp.]MBQ3779868.1 EcsC family protein [Fibrobacter sp.]MBQ7080977.1 EcsC family protein [Fibrobacter sp.]